MYFIGSAEHQPPAQVKSSSRLMQAVDTVQRFMREFNYAFFDSCVYRKPPEAKYTYVFTCTVSEFIHFILGNREVAESISSHTSTLISLLSNPACRLIKPIDIDYNFIEVLPAGTLFDIAGKCFVTDDAQLKGESLSIEILSFPHGQLSVFVCRLAT
jgi:hypothetical protein